LAAFLKAIFNLLLPFGTLLLNILPPLILLFGANLNQDVNFFEWSNFLNPSGPISLMIDKIVAWLTPSICIKSTPSKY
jgi:hypothetical protein